MPLQNISQLPTETAEASPSPASPDLPLFHGARSAELLGQVARIARTDVPVLIVGETGTGKELIARRLHGQSGRKGPFLAVNCGALSEQLIDAELFGHEAGAFTGAARALPGWFEAADGGTLFLDEIGDLPLALQVKLLRVLQERQVVRLGSRKAIDLDVRVVAATNVELSAAVAARRFRSDLYYRLSVASVSLPPLRQRRTDILPLAEHFVAQYAPRLGMKQIEIADDAQAALLEHPWPGNIRELENVIHYALIVSHGTIRASHLKLRPAVEAIAAPVVSESTPTAMAPSGDTNASTTDRLGAELRALLATRCPDLFDTVEATLVWAAYELAGYNQVKAAAKLGIGRNPMRTLLKRHGFMVSDDEQPAARSEGGARAGASVHAGDHLAVVSSRAA